MAILAFILVLAKLLLCVPQISSETDTITQFQSLRDGTTLVSQGGTFELGFFSPGSSTNRYLGIWFKNIPVKTVVWIANRDNPVEDDSSKLSISKEGNLVILSKNGTVYWSTNATAKGLNARATLMDSGNLMLRDDNNSESYLWQSFDYPTDTLLPVMKLRWNRTSGLHPPLTAWKNWDNPSSGDFTYGVNPGNNPEMAIWNGSSMFYRSGPWNGVRFSGSPSPKYSPLFTIDFKYEDDEYYLIYTPRDDSVISRIVINQTVPALRPDVWSEGNWKLYPIDQLVDNCDSYRLCGSFGQCDINESPVCQCLRGFKPKSPHDWIAKDWSEGCARSETWNCRYTNKDGFIKFNNLKVPDTENSWLNTSMTLEECRARCWENCSCTAFANSDITGGGSGCIIWFGDLMDLRKIGDAGQDLYVRLAASEIANQGTKDDPKKMVVAVIGTLSLIIIMILIFTLIYWRTKTKLRGIVVKQLGKIIKTIVKKNEIIQEDLELPFFDFDIIARATDDFSNGKKLGEGGFGPVYRGTLLDGQDVAIKRLSHRSTQGSQEFRNEVIFCSKLQHRNLVKVLGYSIEEEEQLIIYEYMLNKSLDFFLFDSSRSKLLDWPKRFNIICGIARGLLYLYQDSRLRIIHRDLKSSNILLDNDMNQKISDFGLARMCGSDQIDGHTSRVVGTYGYMAPEYAIDGIFSIKSDMFSFGILLLEIVSGKRNKGISCSIGGYNLIGNAWRLWQECIPKEFIDTCLEDSYILSEALRCIHIGLLSVQHHPNDRPTMSSVVVMLNSNSVLPQPKEPIFLIEKVSLGGDSSFGQKTYCSTNEVSASVLEPR